MRVETLHRISILTLRGQVSCEEGLVCVMDCTLFGVDRKVLSNLQNYEEN